jgi:type I restriction enzyme S subunit
MSSEKWKPIKLGDALTLKRGYDLTHTDRKPGSIPVISSSGFSGFHHIAMVKGPGVVTGRYGTLGELFFVEQDFWPHNTTLYVKDFKGNDPRFIFYLLKTLNFGEKNDKTSVPGLNRNDLHLIDINLPPLPTQRRIASILTALDDKIELNRRMNETLEGIAQAVWGEWFGMYASGEEELPEGWRWGKLGDVAQTKKGQIKPDEMTDDLQYVGLEHITRKSLSLTDSGTAGKLESNKFRFSKGDLLFGKLRPYFHKVCIAPFDGVCSTDILVIEPKAPEWYAFVVFHFYSNDLIAFTTSTADGTRMPRTSWGDLSGFEIAIPPKKLASDFTEIVKPIFEKMLENIHQSRTLTALRDTLLPRLMLGEMFS